jgi:hypothetical protein
MKLNDYTIYVNYDNISIDTKCPLYISCKHFDYYTNIFPPDVMTNYIEMCCEEQVDKSHMSLILAFLKLLKVEQVILIDKSQYKLSLIANGITYFEKLGFKQMSFYIRNMTTDEIYKIRNENYAVLKTITLKKLKTELRKSITNMNTNIISLQQQYQKNKTKLMKWYNSKLVYYTYLLKYIEQKPDSMYLTEYLSDKHNINLTEWTGWLKHNKLYLDIGKEQHIQMYLPKTFYILESVLNMGDRFIYEL